MHKNKKIKKYIKVFLLFLFIFIVPFLAVFAYIDVQMNKEGIINIDNLLGNDNDATPPPMATTSPQEVMALPKDISALGGYNVLIADRGNNRVIEVTPDKKIIWEYQFKNLPLGYGADDSFFADNGNTVIVNLEYYQLLEQIDYQTKQVTWQYGTPGTHGSSKNYLYTPDDAYKLANGDVMVADIKNCRILEIAPDKSLVRQYGKTRQCSSKSGYLDAPNGDTPLPNGHVFISTILNHSLLELDSQWKPVFSMVLPLKYPSDPQLTKAGNILIADYSNPGKIIEISRQGSILWEYDGEGSIKLNRPSLAIELPNGNILANDDYNNRVIVIDKKTKKIIWQYGVTGKPGNADGQLSIPDGLDIIKHSQPMQTSTTNTSQTSMSSASSVHTVGQVTWHPQQFVDTTVLIRGYLIKKESGYIIFSDEPNGLISSHDLPIVGNGIETIKPNQLYILEGTFVDHGLIASNGNTYHLELSVLPKITN